MPELASQWREVVKQNRLDDFEHVWNLELERVDEPNRRGDGWSEVCRTTVRLPGKGERTVYIKRQQNYFTRRWPTVWKKLPTFRVEYQNIMMMQEASLPIVSPLYYGEIADPEGNRSVLITIGLDDYQPLSALEDRPAHSHDPVTDKRRLIQCLARTISAIHQLGLQHGCLYPKHIYVKQLNGDCDIRFIDLEKIAKFSWTNSGIFRDLDSFNRHARNWSTGDRGRFLEIYCKLTGQNWRELFKRLSISYRGWIA